MKIGKGLKVGELTERLWLFSENILTCSFKGGGYISSRKDKPWTEVLVSLSIHWWLVLNKRGALLPDEQIFCFKS